MIGVRRDVSDFALAYFEGFSVFDDGLTRAGEEDDNLFFAFGVVQAAIGAGGQVNPAYLDSVGLRRACEEALIFGFVVKFYNCNIFGHDKSPKQFKEARD